CASLAAAAAGGGSLLCLPHHASHIAPPPSPRPHNASTVGTPIATPLSSASPPTAAPARPHLRRRRHYPLFAALPPSPASPSPPRRATSPSAAPPAYLPGVPIPSSPRRFPIHRPRCTPHAATPQRNPPAS
ncbi:Os07g0574400, partial [Oryza sativa Japonica Group]